MRIGIWLRISESAHGLEVHYAGTKAKNPVEELWPIWDQNVLVHLPPLLWLKWHLVIGSNNVWASNRYAALWRSWRRIAKNGADIPLINEDFSQELKDIIYKCLALNPWDRPTARQIADYTSQHINEVLSPLVCQTTAMILCKRKRTKPMRIPLAHTLLT